MRKTVLLLVVLSTAFLGLMVPAQACGGDCSRVRPFIGVAVGDAYFVPADDVPCPIDTCPDCSVEPFFGLRTDTYARGRAVPMGRVEVVFAHCTPPGPNFAGRAVLTAASGDEVFISYEGVLPEGELPPVVKGDIVFEIVGGTGRFDGASGGGTMTVYLENLGFEVPSWPGIWMWRGRIEY